MKLLNLADVCRSALLHVVEVPGWRTRGRSNNSGYTPGLPTHVMVHHTATRPITDGQRDVDYIVSNAPYPPVSNLYLDRDGTVWVCAAGPSNTNGKGSDWWGGGVPDNQMNTHAIGIEAANDGVGEPWPERQQLAYIELVAALCDLYDIPVGNVRAHHEWTTRKIDPAGNSRWATGGNKWDMNRFRGDVFRELAATSPDRPAPPLTTEDEPDMFRIRYRDDSYPAGSYTGLICNGPQLGWISDGHGDAAFGKAAVKIVDDLTAHELDGLIRSSQTTTKPPPEFSAARKQAWNERRG